VRVTQATYPLFQPFTQLTAIWSAPAAHSPFEFHGDTSAEPVASVGGTGYWWMPGLEASGVPLANFALQLSEHPSGHTP
jgi:hypothetical protein